jgi:hypothetical protein
MSVSYFSSADSGAPVLTAQVGSLIALMDVLLVGTGTAYGSKQKAGWTKPFSGTDKAVYLTSDGIGYYRVQHDASVDAREPVVRGAEGATDVDTLVDAFPTTAQHANAACVWRISTTTGATAKPWVALAGPNFFWLIVEMSGANFELYVMGAYSPIDGANDWPHFVNTRGLAASNTTFLSGQIARSTITGAFSTRFYAMRSPDGSVRSAPCAFVSSSVSAALRMPGNDGPPMPAPDGRIYREPLLLVVNGAQSTTYTNGQIAGYARNVWSPLHGSYSGVARLDTFQDSAYNAAAQFVIVDTISGAITGPGRLIWETTDTWSLG